MIELLFLLLFSCVFLIAPVLAILGLLRDLRDAHSRAGDFAILASGLRRHLYALKAGDIARFKAGLSAWLESMTPRLDHKDAQLAARLLLEAQVVALGEHSRAALAEDSDYKASIIAAFQDLLNHLEDGEGRMVLFSTAWLIGLPTCYRAPNVRPRAAPYPDVVTYSAEQLATASLQVRKDPLAAHTTLTAATATLAATARADDAALPLLLLHWATIAVRDPGPADSHWPEAPTRRLRALSRRLRLLADSLRVRDADGIAGLLYASW